MKDKFIYKNPPDSGLGDRILDIITLYSYSLLLNYKYFYVYWHDNPNGYQCLKLQNLINYIKFPENIIFVSNEDINDLCNDINNFVFTDALSATSLFLFQNKYLHINDYDKFSKLYFESFYKIKFNNIPDYIINTFKNENIVTIHLRRKDKVNNIPAAHGVDKNELILLDKITKKYIQDILNKNYKICFISDDTLVKNEYIDYFKDSSNIIYFNEENESLQTYIDYYCLANSCEIFMSQKFSTFSITASLINNSKLIYCFDYGRIIEYDNIQYNFNKYPNFFKY